MQQRTVVIYLLAWLGLAIIAILNGTLRERVYGNHLTERQRHQLSTLILMILSGAFVWLVQEFQPLSSAREACLIGIAWLGMTILFEFGFGHFIAGHSWKRLLADYNVLDGRVWPIFLLWIALAPLAFFYA